MYQLAFLFIYICYSCSRLLVVKIIQESQCCVRRKMSYDFRSLIIAHKRVTAALQELLVFVIPSRLQFYRGYTSTEFFFKEIKFHENLIIRAVRQLQEKGEAFDPHAIIDALNHNNDLSEAPCEGSKEMLMKMANLHRNIAAELIRLLDKHVAHIQKQSLGFVTVDIMLREITEHDNHQTRFKRKAAQCDFF